jgi:hypothetical protein
VITPPEVRITADGRVVPGTSPDLGKQAGPEHPFEVKKTPGTVLETCHEL